MILKKFRIPKFLIFFLLIITCSCSLFTRKNSTFYWERSTPLAEGINPLTIDSIHQEILNGDFGLIDHLLLIRHGKVVLDNHYIHDYKKIAEKHDTTNFMYNYDHPAWHPFYNNTELHSLQSVSKSITSVLLGIAIDNGYIKNVNIPVMPMFSNYKTETGNELKDAIILEDLLTMRSGMKWDESSLHIPEENNCVMLELSKNWVQYIMNQPMDTIPGTVFVYNGGATVLLGEIIKHTTGMHIDEWAEKKLFEPLGINNYYWKKSPIGEIDTEGGLYLSIYDVAKIGYLFLNDGIWEGKQVISKEWVKKSTSPLIDINTISYGYQWWVLQKNYNKTAIFAGMGYGDQFLMVAPQYDLVLVINGWNIHEYPKKYIYQVLQKRILPSTKL